MHVHSNIFVNHWKFWIKCELLLALFTSSHSCQISAKVFKDLCVLRVTFTQKRKPNGSLLSREKKKRSTWEYLSTKSHHEVHVLRYFNLVFISRVKETENESLVRGVEHFLRRAKFPKISELVPKNSGTTFAPFQKSCGFREKKDCSKSLFFPRIATSFFRSA